MCNQLDKILRLVRRTGDRMFVVDRYGEDGGYIVMGVDEYERLIDTAEQNEADFYSEMEQMKEMDDVDDINNNMDDDEEKEEEIPEISDFDFSENSELDNTQDYGRINPVSEIGVSRPKNARKSWAIPADVKQAGEEIAQDYGFSEAKSQDDDDRYYLETI